MGGLGMPGLGGGGMGMGGSSASSSATATTTTGMLLFHNCLNENSSITNVYA